MDPREPGRGCIICGALVELFLDLGHTALANKFLTGDELVRPEPTFPLRVGFCHTCGHVQLTQIVPPPEMFTDYLYMSSASDTLKAHLYDLSDIVMSRHDVRPWDLVMDIGCNDGSLLEGFRRHGVRTLGVDPAENLAERMAGSGIERFVGFFTERTAGEIVARWGQARVITATNTFPHIPDLCDLVAGLDRALAPGGVIVLEMHYLLDLIEQTAFDTIYHEHVSYWALGPLTRLFESMGMEIVDAERLPLHHGQLRVFVQRRGDACVSRAVGDILALERTKGLGAVETFRQFAARTVQIKGKVAATLRRLKAEGARVVGYGAPAKGNTLLAFLDIGPDVLEYIVDRSPLKQGRYTPGMHIPVVSTSRLIEDRPDYVLILAWNFVDEILEQQAAYRALGGRFIVPVPEFVTL